MDCRKGGIREKKERGRNKGCTRRRERDYLGRNWRDCGRGEEREESWLGEIERRYTGDFKGGAGKSRERKRRGWWDEECRVGKKGSKEGAEKMEEVG